MYMTYLQHSMQLYKAEVAIALKIFKDERAVNQS